MAQHGYLHDTYDNGDFGGGDDRDRERGPERERSWRDDGREAGWRSRDRGMMFGDGDREQSRRSRHDQDCRSGGGEGGGFFSRMADEVGSWFDEDESQQHGRGRQGGSGEHRSSGQQGQPWRGGMRHYGAEHGTGGFQGDYSRGGSRQGGFGGRADWEGGRQSYSSHPDDHYRSWRDKQVQQLDNDYRDYCREREQQFHSDFDTWRQQRQSQGQQSMGQSGSGQSSSSATGAGLTGGSTAQGLGGGASGTSGNDELMLDRNTAGMSTDAPQEPQSTVDTNSGATLGTTAGTGGRNRK